MGDDELYARALRSAIERSGLSLTGISQRLRASNRPVSVATLSNWRSGRSLPGGEQSLGVIAALEELLGLAPDSLADLVGGPRLVGRAVQRTKFVGQSGHGRNAFREALVELGFESPQQYAHERVFHQLAIIDSSRQHQEIVSRVTVRALESGVCRLPAVHILDPSEANVAPEYEPLDGCTIGRRVVWPDRRTYGVELLVDGRLDAGQVASFGYRVVTHSEATAMEGTFYSLARRAHDVLFEAEFRGPQKPLQCERYRRTDSTESVTPVRLDHRNRIQLAESRFGPGSVGLRWTWGADDAGDELDDDVDGALDGLDRWADDGVGAGAADGLRGEVGGADGS